MDDEFRHVPCSNRNCGRSVDVTRGHWAVERRMEVQDPVGHVVGISRAESIGVYHPGCLQGVQP